MAISKVTSGGIADGTLSVEDIADDAVTAAKLANSINTDIATGVTGNTTANAALPKAGGAMTGTITGFTSTGIDDNANALAITIDSSEKVGIGTTSPNAPLSVVASSNANAIRMYGRSDGYSELYGSSNDGSTNNAFLQVGTDQTKLYTLAAKPLLFGTNSTERVRIHSSGVMSVPNGIELGSGLDATAANTLSDYETGSWTPIHGGNNMTINSAALYTKVGSMVHIQFDATSAAGSTSSPNISGLPFTAADAYSVFTCGYASQSSGVQGGYVIKNATILKCIVAGTTANDNIVAGNRVMIACTYQTA